MKLLAWVFPVLLCVVPNLADAGVFYRAGQKNHSSFTQLLHGELSAGYLFSNVYLQDYTAQTSSDRLQGWSARGLWNPLSWFSAGVEYTRLANANLPQAWVNSYIQSRLGAIVKVTLSPDTNPRLYLIGGYGTTKHRLEFNRMFPASEKSQTYWMAGLGVETHIYKPFFAALEGNMYWHQSAHIHPYYQLSYRVEAAFQLRAGVRF